MRETNIKGVDRQFVERWSSRDFDGTPLTQEQMDTLLEAMRWTPSSYNEQPWKLHYPKTKERQQDFFNLLAEGNQEWAKNAGALFFLVAKRKLSKTGEENRHYAFDTGAAWMALALQAYLMGLSAHAMGGFNEEQAYSVLDIARDEYEIFAAVAVGKPTQKAKETEERTSRKTPTEITDNRV